MCTAMWSRKCAGLKPEQTKTASSTKPETVCKTRQAGGKPYVLPLPEPAPEDGAGAAAGAVPAAVALMLAFFSS